MEHRERRQACCRVGVAASFVDVGVGCATHGHVRIPYTNIPFGGASHIDLKDNGARGDVCDGKTHILNLRKARLPGVANHNYRYGVISIAKSAANSCKSSATVG